MMTRLGSANAVMTIVNALTILALGFLARPEEFALFLLGLAISQPVASVAALRLDSAFPTVRLARSLDVLLFMAFAAAVLVTLLQLAVVLILRHHSFFELDQLSAGAVAALPLITFAQALVQIGRQWAVRFGDIRRISRASYARAGAALILRGSVILFLLLDQRQSHLGDIAFTLLLFEVLSTALMAAMLLTVVPFSHLLTGFRMTYARAALHRNWKTPLLETPSTLINTAAMNAPLFLVTEFFGLKAAGLFGLASRGLSGPIAQISRTIGEVLLVRYAEYYRGQLKSEFVNLFNRSTIVMSAGALAGLLSITGAYLVVIYTLADPEWRTAATMVVILAPSTACSAIVNINSRLIVLLRRHELKLIYDSVLVSAVAILVYVDRFQLSLLEFIFVISFTQVSGYLVYYRLLVAAIDSRMRARQCSTPHSG